MFMDPDLRRDDGPFSNPAGRSREMGDGENPDLQIGLAKQEKTCSTYVLAGIGTWRIRFRLGVGGCFGLSASI